MHKRKTRKQQANELLQRVSDGPYDLKQKGFVSNDRYKLWVEFWIVPAIKNLIPELRIRKPKRESGMIQGDPIACVKEVFKS